MKSIKNETKAKSPEENLIKKSVSSTSSCGILDCLEDEDPNPGPTNINSYAADGEILVSNYRVRTKANVDSNPLSY